MVVASQEGIDTALTTWKFMWKEGTSLRAEQPPSARDQQHFHFSCLPRAAAAATASDSSQLRVSIPLPTFIQAISPSQQPGGPGAGPRFFLPVPFPCGLGRGYWVACLPA